MVALHPTFVDKSRLVTLKADGNWHAFGFVFDGKATTKVVVPAGTYLLQYQLLGSSVTPGRLDTRIQRYPLDPADNGTAWDYIELPGGSWFGTRVGKVVVHQDGTYSTASGLDYRVRTRGQVVKASQRVLKFVRQRDD